MAGLLRDDDERSGWDRARYAFGCARMERRTVEELIEVAIEAEDLHANALRRAYDKARAYAKGEGEITLRRSATKIDKTGCYAMFWFVIKRKERA